MWRSLGVGWLGDRLGSRAALGLTLCGDIVFFSCTAFASSVEMIMAVRFMAGVSSPLVACLLYIFERARDKMHALEGVNAYSASVNFGYALGGVIVGVGYTSMGWVGLNVLSAVVAAVGLVLVATLATPPVPKPPAPAPAAPGPATDTPAVTEAAAAPGGKAWLDTDTPLGAKPAAAAAGPDTGAPALGIPVAAAGGAFTGTRPGGKPAAAVAAAGVGAGAAVEAGSLVVTKAQPPPQPDEGSVFRAYCSGAMISHMYTAFNVGYQFMGTVVTFVLIAKQVMGWSATAIGWSFLMIPLSNAFAMYFFIPRWGALNHDRHVPSRSLTILLCRQVASHDVGYVT